MKKIGFTLAEVLITLTIVGVVSALVMPTFTAQIGNAKIGPRLAKAVSSFEQATGLVLDDRGSNRLALSFLRTVQNDFDLHNFWDAMANHLKGNKSSDFSVHGYYYAKDGVAYSAYYRDCKPEQAMQIPSKRVVCSKFMIDINGRESGPNKVARDQFYFQLMDDGSLRPWGGSWEAAGQRWHENDNSGICEKNRKPVNPDYCAGHVMENNLKVEYN